PYPACIVKGDDFRGGYLATSHLIELGARRIAFISGPLDCNIYIDRYAGFEKAMQQKGVPVLHHLMAYQELNADNARRAMHRFFSKKPYPDAIFAANDLSALTALQFAREIGIDVPGELRIMGYSNDPRSAIVTPSISTINQFPVKIGKAVVRELLKILQEGQPVSIEQAPVITPIELIRRMST
ncbi:MAG TPA: substrate-binding domain-containing protein, partial [Chitinophagaceae bacterium]|nr:substrate-binding domain-containing protein [Chitinophagaceae bacterium]